MSARRHLVGEGSQVVLHDGSRTLTLGEREWCVLRQMDGTRDLEGLERASARAGRVVGRAQIEAFVAQLAELGLLETHAPDGADEPPEAVPTRDLPVVPMPGRAFHCSGLGRCCELYETMLATPIEAMRARALLPQRADLGPALEDVFTPERGLRAPLLALPLAARGCAYLEADRRCALHAAGGAEAKPFGCRSHPMIMLDVGDAIRFAPRCSCACAFELSSEPLSVPATGAGLDPRRVVSRLGLVRAGAGRMTPPELLAWLGALPEEGDVAERLERAADSLAPDRGEAPDYARWAELRASRLLPQRPVQGVLAAVRAAATIEAAAASRPEDEALYFETFRFAPLFEEPTLEDALRARARRVRLARALEGAIDHPLAAVEALALGHDLP